MEKKSIFHLLFETALRHLLSAEKKMCENLEKMIDKSTLDALTQFLEEHKYQTENQITRLHQIGKLLDINFKSSKIKDVEGVLEKGKEMLKTAIDLNFTDKSRGMDGMIDEGNELIRHFGKTEVGNLALIIAAKKVETFEVACYEQLCQLAESYGIDRVVNLLSTSLEEEKQAAQKLGDLLQKELEEKKTALGV